MQVFTYATILDVSTTDSLEMRRLRLSGLNEDQMASKKQNQELG